MSVLQKLGGMLPGRSSRDLPRADLDDAASRVRAMSGIRWRRWILLLLILIALYYPLGMVWVHKIDDDTGFALAKIDDGSSRAIAVTSALIEREVDTNRWTANDPWFMPAAALDNMPNFQQGIIAALSRFAVEMVDQIGRTRGSSQSDPDLEKAAGLLKYSGTVWLIDPKVSRWIPTASSEKQYRAARAALLAYNSRLAAGNAVFERRADNFLGTLDRFAADMGSSSASLDRHVRERSGHVIDFEADNLFYNIKGRTYAYYLVLSALGTDFENVLSERELTAVWQQLLDSLRAAAELDPWVVVNGTPDSQILPSHLAAQGFYLLRARTQLKEITNILLK